MANAPAIAPPTAEKASCTERACRASRIAFAALLFSTQLVLGQPTAEPIEASGVIWVRAYCSACHSLKLVISNQASRAGWEITIRKMQSDHNLAEIPEVAENAILDYLETHYAPVAQPRRPPLAAHLMPACMAPTDASCN